MTPQRPSAFAHIDHRNSLLPVTSEARTIVITRGDLLAGLALFAAVCVGVAV